MSCQRRSDLAGFEFSVLFISLFNKHALYLEQPLIIKEALFPLTLLIAIKMATKTKLKGLISLVLKHQSLLTVRIEYCGTYVRKSVT